MTAPDQGGGVLIGPFGAPETAAAPGQAEYEVWRAAVPDYVCNIPAGPWDELPQSIQAGFAALAAQERPAPEDERLQAVASSLTKAVERLGTDRSLAMTALKQIISSGDPVEIDEIANAALDAMSENAGGTLPPSAAERPAPELAAALGEFAPETEAVDRDAPAFKMGLAFEQAQAMGEPLSACWEAAYQAAVEADAYRTLGKVAAGRDQLRELLDETGVMAANAPEDGGSFGLLEEIAMRVAAAEVEPLPAQPAPDLRTAWRLAEERQAKLAVTAAERDDLARALDERNAQHKQLLDGFDLVDGLTDGDQHGVAVLEAAELASAYRDAGYPVRDDLSHLATEA